jgi:hypothetical protein
MDFEVKSRYRKSKADCPWIAKKKLNNCENVCVPYITKYRRDPIPCRGIEAANLEIQKMKQMADILFRAPKVLKWRV